MNIQWYPGHMTKTKRQMQEDIKLIDVVLELVDARTPISSKNPEIDEIAKNKPKMILFNKIDMADPVQTAKWVEYYKGKGIPVIGINSRTGDGFSTLNKALQDMCADMMERNRKKGYIFKAIRVMIVGIPNVGKSTFINRWVGKNMAKTGNKPGVTRGKQWIRLKKDIELLDTPGILWPKFEDQQVGAKLAIIGSIKDELLHIDELCLILLDYLMKFYPNVIKERYGIEVTDRTSAQCLIEIGEKRNFKRPGGDIDYSKTALTIIDEYRNLKLGRITLETVDYQVWEGVNDKQNKEDKPKRTYNKPNKRASKSVSGGISSGGDEDLSDGFEREDSENPSNL